MVWLVSSLANFAVTQMSVYEYEDPFPVHSYSNQEQKCKTNSVTHSLCNILIYFRL